MVVIIDECWVCYDLKSTLNMILLFKKIPEVEHHFFMEFLKKIFSKIVVSALCIITCLRNK